MSVGQKKLIKLAVVAILVIIVYFINPEGSYLRNLALCMPSYLAVTFGSYSFMKIGLKMTSI